MSNIDKANQFKNLGNQAFKNKNYPEAIKYFTQAIENNPNDHVFFSNRSGSYLNNGDYEKALEDADHCIKMNSTWPRGYQRKGTALFYMDRLDEAIEVYEEGLKHDPNNQGLQKDLKAAKDKMKSNPMMNEKSLGAMMKLIGNPETKDYINDPEFMQKIQMILSNPAALSYFSSDPRIQKAMQVIGDPNEAFNFEEMMKKMPKRDMPTEEKKQTSSKMEEEPIRPPSPKKEKKPEPKMQEQLSPAEEMKNKGNTEFKNKNFTKACEFYLEAIKLNPDEPLYLNNLAAAHIEANQFDKAHDAIAKAELIFEEGRCKEYSKKAKVYARKGNLLTKQGKYAEAIVYYEKSLVEDGVSKVRDELKKAKKLLKQKEQKEYINPQLAQKACEDGNALFKEGKFPGALSCYEEAIKRNPAVAKYYSNLGTVYIKLMQWQRAKENFQKCLDRDPNYIKAIGKKGDCHFALKQFHKALETYEKGLKIDSQNQVCKAGLQKTQMAIYSGGGASKQDQEQRAQKAMADPEIQAILSTPEVRNALNDLQQNPAAIQNIMKNPSLAQKIQKLIQAGVIGMG